MSASSWDEMRILKKKPHAFTLEIHTPSFTMELAYPTQCTNEFCMMLFKEFDHQKAKAEQLKIENEVLRISLSDCATSNENVIHELRRLLEKETGLVNIANAQLLPDPTGMYPSCQSCMHYRQQAKLVREANAQEYVWVSHFAKVSKNMRLELQDALIKEKAMHTQLRNAYDELHAKKTDPFGRDPEVLRLRGELHEARQNQSNANQTAWTANRVTETLRKELQNSQQRVIELELENHNLSVKVKKLEEIVDACKRSADLKGQLVGDCKDYLCLKRVIDHCNKEREYHNRIDELQRENAYNMNKIMQLRQDAEQWKALIGGEDTISVDDTQAMEEPEQAVKKVAKIPKALLVADLTNFDELRMNIYSLYTLWSAWNDGTMDGDQLLHNLLLDIAPTERRQNLVSMLLACHGNSMPSGMKEEDVQPSNKLVRDSFFACIKSLGGVSKKCAGGRVVWANVKQNRPPIYNA